MIRLETFENNSFSTIKNISEESFISLKLDCEILKLSYCQYVIFKYLQLNIKDYSNFIERNSNVSVINIDVNYLTNKNVVLEVNKLILNFLISFKLFIGNTEKFISRKYGKNSKHILDFGKLQNDYFDNEFAYRFLSNLRDYMAHLGFPLQALAFKIIERTINPKDMVGDVRLLIDIKLLQKEKSTFRGPVRIDLLKMKDDIDLKPLIQDLSIIIIDIQKHIYKIQKDEILTSIENIKTFVGCHKTESNKIIVSYNMSRENDVVEFNIYDVPFDIIKEFDLLKNWC